MSNKVFFDSLSNIFDKKDIELEKFSKEPFSKDWSSIIPSEPLAVVFPRVLEQVIDIVNLCNIASIPFIGSGGRTGLSGGATSINNELIISFAKMKTILDFDASDNTVTCLPGVITEQLQKFAFDNDLYYPVEFSSSGSSQIGGNIATNAGGIKVIKYGSTGAYVKGLEVVSGGGHHHNFDSRLVKNATGPDLKNIFVGSEGIFGLITSCRMKLINKPPETKTAIIAFNEINILNELTKAFFENNSIEAIEFFTHKCLLMVKEAFPESNNLEIKSKYFIIIEYSGSSVEENLEKLAIYKNVDDVLISQSNAQSQKMWQSRMLISESITNKMPLKFDLAVRVNRFIDLIAGIENFIKDYHDIDPVLFGHIGDGNLHVNFVSKESKNIDSNISLEISSKIYGLIKKLNGTISAEHGIGFLKREAFLEFAQKHDLKALRQIKDLYDPNNLLNPGKLIS